MNTIIVNNSKYKVSEEGVLIPLEATIEKENKKDNINPKHYKRDNGMESIEEMIKVFGVEAVRHFCICNVWKYRYRASEKNGEEDLKKSDWYMKKYVELLDTTN